MLVLAHGKFNINVAHNGDGGHGGAATTMAGLAALLWRGEEAAASSFFSRRGLRRLRLPQQQRQQRSCRSSSCLGLHRYWWSQVDKENEVHWVSWEKLARVKKNGGLGFRELHAFDLAMLETQARRLLQNPSSLCAQVFSARYYPDGSILEAFPTCGISYTWHGIL